MTFVSETVNDTRPPETFPSDTCPVAPSDCGITPLKLFPVCTKLKVPWNALPLEHVQDQRQLPLTDADAPASGAARCCRRVGATGGRGAGASSTPDTDLSRLPTLPPVLPAWATARDASAQTANDTTTPAKTPKGLRRLMPTPGTLQERVV